MAFLATKNDVSKRDHDVLVHSFHNQGFAANRSAKRTEYVPSVANVGFEDLDDSRQPESVAAVLKVFGILQALTEQRDIGISDISQRLAMPKATVYRFLQTMKSLGYVQQAQESERYGLTMRIFELGSKALAFPDIIHIADRQMQSLSQTSSETIHLGALIDNEMVYIHKVDSPSILNMNSRIGQRIPLHCSAIGKTLLAFGQPDMTKKVLEQLDFIHCQPATITNIDVMRSELEKVRLQGYATDMREFDQEICCLAVPVFDYLHNVVAGLSMTIPVFRYNSTRQEEYLSMLNQAAREVSRQLGCTDYPF